MTTDRDDFDVVHAEFGPALWRLTAMYAHDVAAREDILQWRCG